MAVRDDLGRIAEPSPDLIRGKWLPGGGKELFHRDVPRAWNTTLARVAGIAVLASELVLRADVEDHQRRVAEPPRQLVPRGNRVEVGLEARLHRMQLDLADLQLAGPGRNAAEQHGHVRMSCKLRHLGS